jgi:uncharacterized phage protein (TIGR02216 family)
MKTEHWGAWLRAALLLGLRPRTFWSLSYREWRLLTESRSSGLSRDELSALMRTYPDF